MGKLTEKHPERWLGGYLRHLARRALERDAGQPCHVLFALCDHFEPLWGKADDRTGQDRVGRWLKGYLDFGRFRDSDGRMPQHTWFFPGEEYRPRFLTELGELAAQGAGEVELHLHHDRDTESGLHAKIAQYLDVFTRHGHLTRTADGRPRYSFIHGNWALANGRPDGRWCGVDAELAVLFETGCYADFTFPSCPDATQPGMVNLIYWPTGDLRRRRAYDGGSRAEVGKWHEDRVLLLTGPLAVARREGGWRPRLEYGALTAHDPPTAARIRTWVSQHIHVRGRPDWVFVKVHTHGAPERHAACLLGAAGHAMHQVLTTDYNDGVRWKLHYVTAREMFNIARAAMEGKAGNPNDYRDYVFAPPPARTVQAGRD